MARPESELKYDTLWPVYGDPSRGTSVQMIWQARIPAESEPVAVRATMSYIVNNAEGPGIPVFPHSTYTIWVPD